MLHRTDNGNAEVVLSIGSRNKELHQETVAVYKLCREFVSGVGEPCWPKG